MIVYNVGRRFFDIKADAERYRVDEGLRPDATIKVEVNDRVELAALLNALCEPPVPAAAAAIPSIVPGRVIDEAFIPADRDVPKFLRDSWAKLMAGSEG